MFETLVMIDMRVLTCLRRPYNTAMVRNHSLYKCKITIWIMARISKNELDAVHIFSEINNITNIEITNLSQSYIIHVQVNITMLV